MNNADISSAAATAFLLLRGKGLVWIECWDMAARESSIIYSTAVVYCYSFFSPLIYSGLSS